MLTWWGRSVVKHRRLALAAALMLVVVGVGWGAGVFAQLVTGGFEDPGSESALANARIAAELGNQNPDVLVLYSSPVLTVDNPSFRDPVAKTVDRLRSRPAVAGVVSHYDGGSSSLVSQDRHATYIASRSMRASMRSPSLISAEARWSPFPSCFSCSSSSSAAWSPPACRC